MNGMKQWKWPLVAFTLLLAVALIMSACIENIYAFKTLRVTIPTEEKKTLTGKLYIPDTSEKTPAVLISAGANNEYNAMEAYAAKLAASGCTVLLFNPYNHGQSDIAYTPEMGADDALEYMYSLNFVDKTRIGAIGHTMGGYYLSHAIQKTGIHLSAMLNIDYVDINGSFERLYEHVDTLGFILARFDEHQRSGNLEATQERFSGIYGKQIAVQHNATLYQNGERTALVIIENINTSLLTASDKALSDTVSFFSEALGFTPQSTTYVNLLFQLRALMMISIFISFAVLMVTALYPRPSIVSASKPHSYRTTAISTAVSIAVFAVLPPLYMIGKKLLMPNAIFPETDTNGLVIWSVFTGFLLMAISFTSGKNTKEKMAGNFRADILKAFAVFALLYTAVLCIIWLTDSNIFILFTSFSPFTKRKMLSWLAYLPLFLAGFTGLSLFTATFSSKRRCVEYILFYIAGPLFMVAIFFLGFPIKGELMFYDSRFALIPIIYMLPFTPLLALVDFYGQRYSKGIVFPVVLNTLLFSWFFTASNALYILL